MLDVTFFVFSRAHMFLILVEIYPTFKTDQLTHTCTHTFFLADLDTCCKMNLSECFHVEYMALSYSPSLPVSQVGVL